MDIKNAAGHEKKYPPSKITKLQFAKIARQHGSQVESISYPYS